MSKLPKGRPKKYAEYDQLVASLPRVMEKRPKYVRGIGVFRGKRDETAWIKIRLPHGGTYGGKRFSAGASLEIKLGNLSSFSWQQLEERHDDLQGRADRNEALEDDAPVLFDDWARDWLGRTEARTGAAATDKICVQKHLVPYFKSKPLLDIDLGDVSRWVSHRLNNGAPSTVKRELNTLKAIFNDGIKHRHMKQNPCQHVQPIKGIVAKQRFLDQEEILTLLASAEDAADWLPDFILWCLHSGMRKGEIMALTWDCVRKVDDDRTIVEIRNSKSDQARMLVCTRTMKEIIERQKARMNDSSELLFPIAAMTLRRKWEKARKVAGLEDVTIHDLRRTNATQAVVAGIDLRTIAGRIGHTDLTMLQKHYAALVGSVAEGAAKKIQDVFDGMLSNGR
jgi:integrase